MALDRDTAAGRSSPSRQLLLGASLVHGEAYSCRAISTAARACARVVSISGTGLSPASRSMPNSVHPRMTACAPRRTRFAIAALNFSRVAGRSMPAEQPDGRDPSLLNLPGGRIDDVQEGEVHSALDPISSGVDGVAGQQEEIRAGRLEFVALLGQQVTDQIPPAFALVAFDLFEIGLRQHEAGAVQAAITRALGDQFVDDPVVDERTGPSDAPHDPDGLHVGAPAEGKR